MGAMQLGDKCCEIQPKNAGLPEVNKESPNDPKMKELWQLVETGTPTEAAPAEELFCQGQHNPHGQPSNHPKNFEGLHNSIPTPRPPRHEGHGG